MTILTQAISEKKLQSKGPNDAKQPLVDDYDHLPSAPTVDVETGSTSSLTSARSRAQRLNSLTTLCVTLTALLVLTTGIVGGIYLYRQFAQYRLRHFRGWCSIPYTEPSERFDELRHNPVIKEDQESGFDLETLFSSFQPKARDDGFSSLHFDQEFDLDVEYGQYEKIEVPDFSNGRKGRFIHDFAKNLTGIVDVGANRCFILPLNRSKVLPPQSLFDLVTKMRNGYYDIDTEMVRDVYRVNGRRISNFSTLGYYIGRECANFDTYHLERVTSPVYKRSTDQTNHLVFHEFAGVGISEIEIVNLADIESHK